MAFEERPFLYVVRADPPPPEAEADWNDWYTMHVGDVTTRQGIMRGYRYKAVRGPSDQPAYIAIYELADGSAIDQATIANPTAHLPEDHQPRGPRSTTGRGSRMIYQRIGPEPDWAQRPLRPYQTEPSSAKAMMMPAQNLPATSGSFEDRPFLYVVRMDLLNPDAEAEFNRWYNMHVGDVCTRPGIMKGYRYQAVFGPTDQAQHMAIYELADEAAIEQAIIPNPLGHLPPERHWNGPAGAFGNASRMVYQRIGPEPEWSRRPVRSFRPAEA